MQIQLTFLTIITTIAKLSILALVGYFLLQRKLINGDFVDMMSRILVRVIFPALIVSKVISNFDPKEYAFWWFFPLSAMLFSLSGMALGAVALKFIKGKCVSPREFMCACGFQNCGYLPMNLIVFAFAGALADKLLVFVFLFILGFDILMWSLVPLFITGKLRSDFKVSALFSAPVIATLFSVSWVALFGKGSMPHLIMDPVKQLGQAAFPLAMMVLGAYLYKYRAFMPERKTPLAVLAMVKLVVFPTIILAALMAVPLDIDRKFFLLLQATLPTAVSMVIIGSYTETDSKFLSSAIFYTHVLSVITIPFWLAVFGYLIK